MKNHSHPVQAAWAHAQDPSLVCPVPSRAIPRPPQWTSSPGVLSTVVGAALGGRGKKRQYPSAGGLYPVEVRALTAETLTLSMAWWRTAEKYSFRAWVSCLLDLGYAIGAVEVSAAAQGVGIRAIETHEDLSRVATITFDALPDASWDGPPASTTPRSSAELPPCADILSECLGFSLDCLSIDPELTLEHLHQRQSGSWEESRGGLSHPAMNALCRDLPARCIVQVLDPDYLGLLKPEKDTPLRPLCRGDARRVLAQWCGGQPLVETCSGAVLFTHPPSVGTDSAAARELGRCLVDAGRHGFHTQVCATMRGIPSRPIAGWVNADIGTAVGWEPALVVHGLVFGPERIQHQ